MKTAIAGSRFSPGGVAALARLRKGATLSLVREAANPHDSNAVAVYAGPAHLGYVPRSVNAGLAQDIDAGQRFVAVLVDEAIIDRGAIRFAPKITITEETTRKSGPSGIVTVAGKIRAHKALAVRFHDGQRTVWLPRSQIEINGDGTISLPEWLAEEKELI